MFLFLSESGSQAPGYPLDIILGNGCNSEMGEHCDVEWVKVGCAISKALKKGFQVVLGNERVSQSFLLNTDTGLGYNIIDMGMKGVWEFPIYSHGNISFRLGTVSPIV